MKFIFGFLLLFCNRLVSSYNHENDLKEHLLQNYSEDILPDEQSTKFKAWFGIKSIK